MWKMICLGFLAASAAAACGGEIPSAVKPFLADPALQPVKAKAFVLRKPGVYAVRDASGNPQGTLYVETIGDNERQKGYAGTIEVAILADNQNRVAGVLIGRNHETPNYLNRVRKSGFLKSWNKLKLEEVPGKQVDTVTRATYSSGAILSGVRKLAAARAAEDKAGTAPPVKAVRKEAQ